MAVSWRKYSTGLDVWGQLAAGWSWESAVTRWVITINIGKAFRSIQYGRCRESGPSWESRCWDSITLPPTQIHRIE